MSCRRQQGLPASGQRTAPISQDHTLVNELVAEGIITPEEGRIHPHRNIILKDWLCESVRPDASCLDLQEEIPYFYALTGFTLYVGRGDLFHIVRKPVEKAGSKLIDCTGPVGSTTLRL